MKWSEMFLTMYGYIITQELVVTLVCCNRSSKTSYIDIIGAPYITYIQYRQYHSASTLLHDVAIEIYLTLSELTCCCNTNV